MGNFDDKFHTFVQPSFTTISNEEAFLQNVQEMLPPYNLSCEGIRRFKSSTSTNLTRELDTTNLCQNCHIDSLTISRKHYILYFVIVKSYLNYFCAFLF